MISLNRTLLLAALAMLGAGCDRTKKDTSLQPPSTDNGPSIDRLAIGAENRAPFMEGAAGTLQYKNGCLFLRSANGEETGLVVPANIQFDGKQLTGILKKPADEATSTALGQFVSLRGQVISNPAGRYACKTKQILIADSF